MSAQTVTKRHQRSLGLYRLLKGDKWEKYITVDEAWFYLSNADGQRSVPYLSREQNKTELFPFTKPSHPKGIMLFLGISNFGTTVPIFVQPGAKINADYYIRNCLKPLIKDSKRLYPNGNWILHQDSAPSHTAKKTLAFLQQNNISFVHPNLWTPSSPDLAPCDYFLWGYLKSQLARSKVDNIAQLKRLIKREIRNIPLAMIQRALKSWSSRCLTVYKNKGLHIK